MRDTEKQQVKIRSEGGIHPLRGSSILLGWCTARLRHVPRACSNPARRLVHGHPLCWQHAALRRKGVQLTVTLQFDPDAFDEEAAATLVLAVKRSLAKGVAGAAASGPLTNHDGVVIGEWRAQQRGKKR